MACEFEDLQSYIENLKAAVRKSFTVIYAGLKAKELKTLRQLDAICKQCENDKDLTTKCIKNIHISFDNESVLLDNINNYSNIDYKRLNFTSNTFVVEDYICPADDHMYSYKCIEDLVEDDNMSTIEAAALKQITESDCVCYVDIKAEDIARKFREDYRSPAESTCDTISIVDNLCSSIVGDLQDLSVIGQNQVNNLIDEKCEYVDPEIKKIKPTDEWLNSIKDQTETEPSQSADVMEYSKIECL